MIHFSSLRPTFCPEARATSNDDGCVFFRARQQRALARFNAAQRRESRRQRLSSAVRFDQRIGGIEKHIPCCGRDFLHNYKRFFAMRLRGDSGSYDCIIIQEMSALIVRAVSISSRENAGAETDSWCV